ncbi:MAG TPA: PqqD family protein [Allosphingosinicella sp.]|nr:PqqD family protein [Allosphingosinicella sp.]
MKDFIVRRAGGLIEAEVDGELIGLEVEQGLCYGFNGTATRIWTLIEEPRRFSELQARLLEEYDVDSETCARELQALLDELKADGLVAVEPLDA